MISKRKSYFSLHHAARSNDVPMVRQLLALGRNINGLDSLDQTPVFVASLNNSWEAACLLIEKGAIPLVNHLPHPREYLRDEVPEEVRFIRLLCPEWSPENHCDLRPEERANVVTYLATVSRAVRILPRELAFEVIGFAYS